MVDSGVDVFVEVAASVLLSDDKDVVDESTSTVDFISVVVAASVVTVVITARQIAQYKML